MTYGSLLQQLIDLWRQPVTVTEAARLLGIPGSMSTAKAQKPRRLGRGRHEPA